MSWLSHLVQQARGSAPSIRPAVSRLPRFLPNDPTTFDMPDVPLPRSAAPPPVVVTAPAAPFDPRFPSARLPVERLCVLIVF